jgi:hypothetical protein
VRLVRPAAPEGGPVKALTFVTICPRCSEPLDEQEVTSSWNEATLWSYLAQLAHQCKTPAAR